MNRKPILEFSKIISGIFSNKDQALKNPKKFAHIQIHIRPLFFKDLKCYAFYSEQRYQHDIWNPYKQGINKLSQEKDIYIFSNHKIENKDRLTGGGLDISLLNQISKYKLHQSEGCDMHFKEIDKGNFIGFIEPGSKCYIKKDGQLTYLKSKVKLTKDMLISEDTGHEIETDKKIWGSKFGPLVFKKIKNFDLFIESNWE